MKTAFVLLLVWAAVVSADHGPRHAEAEIDVMTPEVILPAKHEHEEEGAGPPQVRHHIYMPYPMAYRSSANQQPIIQYVPIYTQDPRFINFNAGAHANLGLFSGGANTAIDAGAGSFSAGAGVGLGQTYTQYGQPGATSLTSSSASYPAVYYNQRSIPKFPIITPQPQPTHLQQPIGFGPPINYAPAVAAPQIARTIPTQHQPTVFYPIYV